MSELQLTLGPVSDDLNPSQGIVKSLFFLKQLLIAALKHRQQPVHRWVLLEGGHRSRRCRNLLYIHVEGGCINQVQRGGSLLLLCSGETPLQSCILLWDPQAIRITQVRGKDLSHGFQTSSSQHKRLNYIYMHIHCQGMHNQTVID